MGFDQPDRGRPGRRDLRDPARRGRGAATLLLHGGPGIGAEHLVSLVEELDGLIDGVLPQQRGLSRARWTVRATSRRTSPTRSPCSTISAGTGPG